MLIRFSLCISLVAFLDSSIGAQTGTKPDFSGTWELNLAKSRLEIPPPTSSTFYITHKEPVFHLKRTHVFKNGKSNTWGIELITDGPEVVQKEDNFHARLFWMQNALVLDSYWIEDGTKTTNIVKYTLSKNDMVFTADEQVTGSKVKHHNVWVFDRK